MTIPRVQEIARFHKLNPPQYLLLNSICKYWGIIKNENEVTDPVSCLDENGGSLFDAFPQG